MINFFRKIRRKFADNNQFLKYSRYAFGEIVLVVVGILIALSINNWNEDRKLEKQEFQYLERLKIDLIQDTIYYNQRIEKANTSIENNSKAIQMAYEIQQNVDDFQNMLSFQSYDSEHLTIQNDTYLELTNSGNLNILQNDNLKISIIALYRSSNEAAKHVKEANEFTVELLTDMTTILTHIKYIPLVWNKDIFYDSKMFKNSDWKFINKPTSYEFKLLENCLAMYIAKQHILLPYYFDLKVKSEHIIEVIDEELKRKNR
jgi:hypothetical protein